MQDTVRIWIDYFVTECHRQSNAVGDDALLREHAELAFYRTDAGFLAPEKAAAIYAREARAPRPSTPWMLDLKALVATGHAAAHGAEA